MTRYNVSYLFFYLFCILHQIFLCKWNLTQYKRDQKTDQKYYTCN